MQAFHLENKFVLLSVPQVQKTLEIQNVKKKKYCYLPELAKDSHVTTGMDFVQYLWTLQLSHYAYLLAS